MKKVSKKHSAHDRLTDREVEIARAMASGKSTKQLSALFHISVATATTHRANIYRKTNTSSLGALVTFLVVEGLYNPVAPDSELMSYKVAFENLRTKVEAVYFAAHWHPDRRVLDANSLWSELRDAAYIPPGSSTKILGPSMITERQEALLKSPTVYVVEEYASGKVSAIFTSEALAREYASRHSGKRIVTWLAHASLETLGPRASFLPKESIVPRPTAEADDALGVRQAGVAQEVDGDRRAP